MSKIALATAIAALTAAVPLGMGRAEAQPLTYMPPGAAPPWSTATTATETGPGPIPATAPVTQSPQTSVESGTTTPIPGTPTPIQGTTTPIHAVFLHAGASGEAPVIGTLHPGEPLRLLASAPGGWMQVETPVGSGWAYGSYLAPAGSTPVVHQSAPPQEIIAR